MSGVKGWSTTAANNVLANTGFTMDEGMSPSSVNDSVRQLMADVRTEWAQGASIASAATVDLSTSTGGYVTITGSTGPITSFGTVSAGIRRKLLFTGTPTITYNATSMITPTAANIVAVAGDTCEIMSEGSGNWRFLWYSGQTVQTTGVQFPVAQVASSNANNLDDYEEGSWTPSVGGTATYNAQTGSYTKIGRLVFIRGTLTINVIGTGSTTVISGLPFTVAATTEGIVRISVNGATAIVSATLEFNAAATTCQILSRVAAAGNDAANAIFQNATTVNVSGSYEV